MGEVYSALDAELGRSVAIKLLPTELTTDEDRRSRFRQEARVISALNHPNIITIYEIGENEHGSFLATEYIEGRTLREVIKRESLTLPRILRIVEQAANALVAAHAAHIVHRDIKPENIMVRSDAIVKVLDFGLAKPNEQIITGSNSGNNKTVPGTVMGSARYMSPEQARGQEVDERTDIWSLGTVLYELLIGRVPFDGETTADTLAAVIYKEPEPIGHLLPNAPLELQRILRKALQKDREERYQSMKDFALDIKDVLYEIEHANSGDRMAFMASSPAFSENPTIIHKTISANHPTDETNVYTSGAQSFAAPSHRGVGLWTTLISAVAGVLVFTLVGFAVYRWLGSEVKLSATAFEKTQISRINTDGKVMQPAISPDGRYVAYVSGEPGNKSLVVRQISTDSSVTIVPTTNLNLQNLTFTPDGDHIYFTQTRNDFAVNTLYQVSTLGGTPKKLIEDIDSAVTFSPDGKQFAFMRHATTDNTDNIFVVNTATLESRPLISTKGSEYDFFANKMAWSPDGEKILVGAGKRQSGFVTRTDIAEISLADKKVTRINDKEFFIAGNFVWFDDGSGFLFSGRETQTSPTQIWRSSYPSASIQQVTNDFNDYLDLGISADGRSLVTVKGDTSSSLWKFSPGTKALTQITNESRNLEGSYGLTQTADGRLIYVRSEAKESDIWTSDADGKDPRPLFNETGFSVSPATTPDGRFIVFNLQKDKASRIWRADADGKNAVQLSEDNADYADFNPQVTPDGQSVLFQRQIANSERSILVKVPIEGGPAEVLYQSDRWSIFQPRVSPDGKRIAFVSYDVNTFEKKLQIATLEGGNFGKVERELEYNLINQIFWSPDGKSLTVLTSRGGTPNLWRLPIDGSDATPVTDFKSGKIMNFAWTPDGKSLLIARGNTNNDLVLIKDAARSSRDTLAEKVKYRRTRSGVL
jgi:serine/threonine protein kinase